MKLTKTGSHGPLPVAKPDPKGVAPERERTSGWAPGARNDGRNTGSRMMPVDVPGLSTAASDAVKQLAPMGVSSVDPLQLLDGVKDGRATVTIPLQPGRYQVRGHSFEVKPGTVVKAQVDVKDGRVVAAFDAHGRPTGRGTKVEVEPPLDLPLWVTGNGAYVQDKGEAQAAFKADLGGFFDLKLKKLESTKLSDVVRAFEGSGGDSAPGFPRGMIRTDQARFSAQVSMRDNVISAGAMKVDLAPGTQVKLEGTSKRAVLDGQVNLDRATLKQGGTDVLLGAGSARLRAEYATQADGTMTLTTDVSQVNARIERASVEHARRGGGEPDLLSIGNATLTNGRFTMAATLEPVRGSALPQLQRSSVRLSGQTEGSLMGAKLTVRDSQDEAELRVGPGRFKGSLDVTPEGTTLEGSITGTTLDVRDLQTKNANARLALSHARFEGDVRVKANTAAGDFDLNVDAKKVDVRIDGYRGQSANNTVDFRRIDLSGAGNVNINSKTGTEITGDMRVRGEVNDLKVGSAVDVAEGAVIDGRATHFHAGGARGFELKGEAQVDAGLDGFAVDAGQVNLTGTGRLRGDAQFDIKNGDLALVVKNGRADVTLNDGRVGNADTAVGLDVAAGSSATLHLDEAHFGKTAAGIETRVKLGRGSVIEATLDEGHVTAGGRRIELDKGSTARFELESLEAKTGNVVPGMKGALTVQAGVQTDDLAGLKLGGIQVNANPVRGKVNLTVPDVRLSTDGRVTYQNAHVALNARVGDVKPGTKAAPLTGARPDGVLSREQVEAMSAAQIAGASGVRGAGFDPMEAAKRVQNGKLKLTIPVEGRLGGGYLSSADFAKGTTMELTLTVKDGKVVPAETRATFSKPGDAALWVTAKGAYLDQNNTLRLDLGGMKDFSVSGLENMPTDVEGFMGRLQAMNKGNGGSGGMSALKLERAAIQVDGATFKPGKLAVPGGHIDVGANTKLSLKGTMQNAVLSGHVELNGVDIAQDGVALKGNQGTADLNITWKNGVATTTLDALNLDTEYAVQKRENGDYLKLAKGRVQNGRLSFAVPVNVSAGTAGMPTSAKLDLERFSGTVEGARLTTVRDGKPLQLELGRAQVDGSVHIDGNRIEVKGDVRNADLKASGLSTTTPAGRVQVDSARLKGDGRVDFSTERGLNVTADVKAMDVKARGDGNNRARITGAGQVEWSSTKGMSLQGDLHVEADVSGELDVKARERARAARRPVQRITVERAAVP
ncbi:MAG: hypothetical protein JNK82_25760 [Myxococcaceae bacterium]|nr:hypothetical protein [Myxococcaceae bacterium]